MRSRDGSGDKNMFTAGVGQRVSASRDLAVKPAFKMDVSQVRPRCLRLCERQCGRCSVLEG